MGNKQTKLNKTKPVENKQQGNDAFAKLQDNKRNNSIKEVEKTQKEIEEGKVEKIAFGEYVPRVYERTWFRWLLVGGLILIAGIVAIIINIISKNASQMPKSIAFSTNTQIYWDSAEDITLRAYLNSDYNGNNKKISLSVAGGNGIVTLSKTEIESGDTFKIRVNLKNGYPIGGKIKVWATADANGIATSVEILIDSPATSIMFNDAKGASEIYVLGTTPFEALAKRGDVIIDSASKVITGRNVIYEGFYACENGDYDKVGDGFVKVNDGEGSYNKLTDDIGTISVNELTAKKEAEIYVQASVKKWSDYNTGEEKDVYITAVKKITCKRIDFSGLSISSFYKENATVIMQNESVTFEFTSLLSVAIDSSKFTNEQKQKCQQYVDISLSSSSAQVIDRTETGFKIKAGVVSGSETVIVTVQYRNNNGDYVQDTFNVQLQEAS